MKDPTALRRDAQAIWQAGVDAVRSDQLVQNVLRLRGDELTVCGHSFCLSKLHRIAVVGAGKAGAGMASAVERALGPETVAQKVRGWVNVPSDCVSELQQIKLHAARPAGVNEPTEAGVEGAERILELVSELGPDDLCLVLISGGGSALLPAPIPPLTLHDKQAVTRFLMHAGAPIEQLNRVRKRLSRIKGGGLARACGNTPTVALVISDIVGDPLDFIASGPTYPDSTTNEEALEVLRRFQAKPPDVPQRVLDFLGETDRPVSGDRPEGGDRPVSGDRPEGGERPEVAESHPTKVANHIIGNNQTAVASAGRRAQSLGYHVILLGSDNQGEANDAGRELAARCLAIRTGRVFGRRLPVCLISGGEPVVHVTPTDQPRRGGRNQQLVLAGLQELWDVGLDRIVLLSGGTDGEDGPTDAAGAWADATLLQAARQLDLHPAPYLAINDSYGYFEKVGGLLKTGPTHTNVMDLRVALVDG